MIPLRRCRWPNGRPALAPASGRWPACSSLTELKLSFGAWRQQLRLARALDLIGRGRPYGEVAAELGYASQAAFSAMFKRAFGVPPGRFMQERSTPPAGDLHND